MFLNRLRMASVKKPQPGKKVPPHPEFFTHMALETIVHPATKALSAVFPVVFCRGIAGAKRRNDKKYHEHMRNN